VGLVQIDDGVCHWAIWQGYPGTIWAVFDECYQAVEMKIEQEQALQLYTSAWSSIPISGHSSTYLIYSDQLLRWTRRLHSLDWTGVGLMRCLDLYCQYAARGTLAFPTELTRSVRTSQSMPASIILTMGSLNTIWSF
jgi:hypothetical protein